jgi:hypothetical protein
MRSLTINPPPCFGLLYEAKNRDCQCCLLNDKCSILQEKEGRKAKIVEDVPVPNERKDLVFAVCKKYGITPEIKDRQGNSVIINEENIQQFRDLGFLLTSKIALTRLLQTNLVEE